MRRTFVKVLPKQLNMNMMKLIAMSIAGLLVLSACKKDDVKAIEAIESDMASGSWRITRYMDSGNDETSNFSGYNFTFSSSGTLSATNGTTTFSGTWSVTDSNSNDDSVDDVDFNIYLSATGNFEDLNDDWDISSHSSSSLSLIDVSGGNGGTDELIFTKN